MNRLALAATLAAAAALLNGCYESDSMLLDASASRQPVTSYQDWTYNHGDGGKYHARLNPRSDGWYEYDEAPVNDDGTDGTWDHHTVLLNYLEDSQGYQVYVSGTWDEDEHAYIYGLVAFGSDGRWQSITPSCDTMSNNQQALTLDTNAAKSAGAQLKEGDMSDVCAFTSRDSLMAAMRTIADDPGFSSRVAAATK